MKYLQENAFGWYVLTVQSKLQAEMVDKIIDEGLKKQQLPKPSDIQTSVWKVEKKKPGDFAMSFPYKVTDGAVCSDCKTLKEAKKLCKEFNDDERAKLKSKVLI